MTQWKDATSYSQGQRGKIEPNSWEATFCGARVWVSRGHRYYPDDWVVGCRDAGIDAKRICGNKETPETAKSVALSYVATKLQNLAEGYAKAAAEMLAAREAKP